jgi:hypothetical protein
MWIIVMIGIGGSFIVLGIAWLVWELWIYRRKQRTKKENDSNRIIRKKSSRMDVFTKSELKSDEPCQMIAETTNNDESIINNPNRI